MEENKYFKPVGFALLFFIISLIITLKTYSGIGFILFIVSIIVLTTLIVLLNKEEANIKGMSGGEYLQDRFANAIPETKQLLNTFHINSDIPSTVKCPNCGANHANLKKISTLNRATSVTMVGIASDKMGKQYECRVCNYKW